MPLLLRRYEDADFAACLAVFDSNVPKFFAPHEREGFASFLGDLARFAVQYYVLVDDPQGARPRVIACAGVGRRDDEARMCWGIVDATRQGEGFGRLLLLVRLVRGAELGARRAGLDTIPSVAPFFEREGFVITGGEDDHYGPGIHRRDLLLMLDDATVASLRARVASLADGRVVFGNGVR
jgi:ribosomal protein S18 acetylase RimI-like enzyme